MAPTGSCRRVVPIQRVSMENSLRKLVKKFERDPTVGSIDTDLLSRFSGRAGGIAPTGRSRRVLPIQRVSMEKSLRKLVKTFERDPTVGSIDTDLLSRYSGREPVELPRPDGVAVSYRFNASPWKTAYGNS